VFVWFVRVLICYFKSNIPIEILQALVAVACAVGIDQRKLNHKNGHTCIDALLIKHDLVKAFFVCFDFYTCLFYFGLLSLLSYCHVLRFSSFIYACAHLQASSLWRNLSYAS